LAPLDVRVIVLVTGVIATKFLSNMPTVVLPKDSYYLAIKNIIAEEPPEIPFGTKPEVFAQEVLHYVENRITGRIWIGAAATLARLAVCLLPQDLLVSVLFTYDKSIRPRRMLRVYATGSCFFELQTVYQAIG
jgi:1-acylglycerone phosphate reductase